jgi:hypothetical protein
VALRQVGVLPHPDGEPDQPPDGVPALALGRTKRVGECRDWFFEQVENRPVSGVLKRLRKSFERVPGPDREAKNPVTH